MRKLLSGSSAHSPNSDSHPRLSASPTPTPPAGSPVDSPTDRGTALFLQCVCDNIAPKIALDTLKLLKHCCNTTRNTTSDTLEIPASQHCCGLPAFDSGDHETARQMAIQTLDTLEGYSRVVTPAPSCVVAVREYVQLFRNDPVLLGRSRDLAARMVDLVGFLSEPANTAKLATSFASATATPSSTPTPQLFTVHPFCQSRTRLHQTDTLTSLIRNVSGVTPVPLAEEDVCCGFGGSASLLRPETSAQILARKLAKVSKTEAGILITDNPGCALHIKGGVESSRLKIEVLHIAEFLATNLFTV